MKTVMMIAALLTAALMGQSIPGLPPLSYGPDTRTGFLQALGPAQPAFTITHGGTPATTAYTYTVVAVDIMNHTKAFAKATATGAATLNTTDYNIVTIAAFTVTDTALQPVGGCKVYRTAGGATQGLIGTVYPCVNGGVLNDTGLTGDATTAATDTASVVAGDIIRAKVTSATNCLSIASPAVCGSASAGAFTVAAAATTKVVNTTAVGLNSQIIVQQDSSLGLRLAVTCNTTVNPWIVTARVPGTSFTLTTTAPVTDPACFNFEIIN